MADFADKAKKRVEKKNESFRAEGKQGYGKPNLNMLQAFLSAMGMLPETRTDPIYSSAPGVDNFGDQTKEKAYAGRAYTSDTFADPRAGKDMPANPALATQALMDQEKSFNPGFPQPKPTGLGLQGALGTLGAPVYNQLYPINPVARTEQRNLGPAAPAPNPVAGPNPQLLQLLQQLGMQGFTP
jgi:hypothetical protein